MLPLVLESLFLTYYCVCGGCGPSEAVKILVKGDSMKLVR